MCFLKSGNLQQSYLELLTPVSRVRVPPWLQKRIGKGGVLMGWPQESVKEEIRARCQTIIDRCICQLAFFNLGLGAVG